MNFEEFLERLEEVIPNAAIDTDNNGQVIIYTGRKREGDDLVPLTEEDLE